MKTIKPLRLSILTRPYLRNGAQYLAMTVIAMTNLKGQQQQLVPEPEIWKTLTDELGGDTVFDLGMPKDNAEFIVSGFAHTAHQPDKSRCAVSVQVGARKKTLLVFGDRFWIDGRATAPQPFDAIRLDWRKAFGGPGFAENPLGIGHDDDIVEGLKVRRVPNIEHANGLLWRPGQVPAPAGFGPIDVARPSRMRKMGRDYDEHWKQNLYPGFARDMDWGYFNAASEDQWLALGERGLAGASYEILNMHPEDPVQRGRLPDWQARGFIVREAKNRQLASGIFDEVSLRLTTAWFFPHREQVALVYHGSIGIEEDDASDISHVMAAMEEGGSERPLASYRDVLIQRCDPENGALYALRDDQLLPPNSIGQWLENSQEEDRDADPLTRNMKVRAERAQAKLAEAFKASGGDPAKFALPPPPITTPPKLHEIPAYVQKMKAMVQEQREKLAKGREAIGKAADANAVQSRKLGFDTSTFLAKAEAAKGKGPPRFDPRPFVDGISGVSAAVGAPPAPPESLAELRRVTADAKRGLLASYRSMAQYQDAADAMPPDESDRARAEIERVLAGSRDFSDMDLTGADLSNMDLHGTRWHRALLEGVDFSNSRLDDADFSEAVLARARLHRTSMRRAIFDRANMALARCEEADFSGARFMKMVLDKMVAKGCNFSDAAMEELNFMTVHLERCSFERAAISYAHVLEKSVMHGVRFDHARIHKMSWIDCDVNELSFAHAELDSCGWVNTDGAGRLDFSAAHLTTTCFVGESSLRKVCFRGAMLRDCSLRGIALDEADFANARIENSDFSGASMHRTNLEGADAKGAMFVRSDLTRASLLDADLSGAILQKAVLVSTDLRRANLFRADLSQCLIDDRTLFDGAYVEQVKTVPLRKKEKVE